MKIHHIGFVVNDIETYEKNMVHELKIKEVVDTFQNAKLSLYSNYNDSFIELIQPLNNKSFTYNALKKFGNHYHHTCYSINNLEELDEIVEKFKLIKFLGPVPAILFDNNLVSFYIDRNKKIVEFVLLEN